MASWPQPVEPNRIRVLEFLRGAVMVTTYEGKRPGEVGNVGFVPHGPRGGSRPGGSAMR